MTVRRFVEILLVSLVNSFGWYLTIIPPIILYYVGTWLAKWLNYDLTAVVIVMFSIAQIVFFLCYLYDEIGSLNDEFRNKFLQDKKQLEIEIQRGKKELFQTKTELERSYRKDKRELEIEVQNEKALLAKTKTELERKEITLREVIDSTRPFGKLAEMRTDLEMVVFDESINFLKFKRYPAYSAADEIRRFKNISAKINREAKEIQYKYEYILEAFPEIKEYIENDLDLLEVGENASYKELEEARDRRKDYLSNEEYSSLTESEKSQLSLKRYLERPKTKWQIGRDYEMSCAFQLIEKGYSVEMHGIKYGLKDLGRDLIAIKSIRGLHDDEVLVIQCKNWSKDRMIRENVIMQLFGSVIMYRIDEHSLFNQKIVPVLMIPPHTVISDVALQFAKKLNVRIWRMANRDYPRIKCNINQGSKIYHLPFDQLYDRTEIKNVGEFYAWSVEEAESKGFRRAKRHMFR